MINEPTDEREALAKVIDDAADAPVSPERVRTSLTLWLADAILAAGFRRSEVPKPKGREAKIHGEFVTMRVEEWRRVTDELSRLRITESDAEPQGEPSDAQVLAALKAADWHDNQGTWKAMRAALRAAGGVR